MINNIRMMKLWMILFQLFFQWHDANLFLSMIPGFELTDPSQLDQFIEKNLEGGRMQCSICKDYSHDRSHVRNHIESKHFPNTFSYDCPYENCGKVFNTCQAFQTHKSRVHKQWWTLYTQRRFHQGGVTFGRGFKESAVVSLTVSRS